QYASAPRVREPRPKSQPAAPMTEAQCKVAKEERDVLQEQINDEVSAWFKYTKGKVAELSKKFNRSERYFYDLFFAAGAHMVHHHTKTNAFSAYLSLKAREIRIADGTPVSLTTLGQTHREEYHKMDTETRTQLVEQHEMLKGSAMTLRRPTPRSRIQDVANIMRNIQLLIVGLQRRAGVEAMVCVFRNTTNYVMEPQWFFSNADIEAYLPIAIGKRWDTAHVGAQLEAFAIAGCN
ncbi:hypothetical protein BDN72DRAFT_738419, partial [Pluteus cervinus]